MHFEFAVSSNNIYLVNQKNIVCEMCFVTVKYLTHWKYKFTQERKTVHYQKEIGSKVSEINDENGQIILYYKATIGPLTLHKLVRTLQEEMQLLAHDNILYVRNFNEYVLWTALKTNWNNKLTKRRKFLEESGKSFIKLHMEPRTHLPRGEEVHNMLVKVQKEKTHNVATSSNEPSTAGIRNEKRVRCKFCPSSYDNKTNILEETCNAHLV